jgi:hypothetical protein
MNEQAQLINAILSQKTNANFETKGLEIYQRNFMANAQRALAITFPVTNMLMGEDLFKAAVERLTHTCAPNAGDWGEWGDGFWNELASMIELEDYPYVADIAEVDFARHKMERTPLKVADRQSIHLLAEYDLDEIKIVLNDDVFIKDSKYPVVDIYQSHCNGFDALLFEKAKDAIKENLSQKILMFRPHYKAKVRSLDLTEYDFIHMVLQGKSLGKSLEHLAIVHEQSFLFEHWLPLALEQNLVSYFKVINRRY